MVQPVASALPVVLKLPSDRMPAHQIAARFPGYDSRPTVSRDVLTVPAQPFVYPTQLSFESHSGAGDAFADGAFGGVLSMASWQGQQDRHKLVGYQVASTFLRLSDAVVLIPARTLAKNQGDLEIHEILEIREVAAGIDGRSIGALLVAESDRESQSDSAGFMVPGLVGTPGTDDRNSYKVHGRNSADLSRCVHVNLDLIVRAGRGTHSSSHQLARVSRYALLAGCQAVIPDLMCNTSKWHHAASPAGWRGCGTAESTRDDRGYVNLSSNSKVGAADDSRFSALREPPETLQGATFYGMMAKKRSRR